MMMLAAFVAVRVGREPCLPFLFSDDSLCICTLPGASVHYNAERGSARSSNLGTGVAYLTVVTVQSILGLSTRSLSWFPKVGDSSGVNQIESTRTKQNSPKAKSLIDSTIGCTTKRIKSADSLLV
jgi:hypothetical protein